MQIEKMNSSLQQRDFEYYKKEKEYEETKEQEKAKKKSLREMFEEEPENNYKHTK